VRKSILKQVGDAKLCISKFENLRDVSRTYFQIPDVDLSLEGLVSVLVWVLKVQSIVLGFGFETLNFRCY